MGVGFDGEVALDVSLRLAPREAAKNSVLIPIFLKWLVANAENLFTVFRWSELWLELLVEESVSESRAPELSRVLSLPVPNGGAAGDGESGFISLS